MIDKNYFQFYETFLEVIEALPIDEQLKYFKAICRYGLFNEKPNLDGKDLAIFLQIQFAIDNQNKRRLINRKNGLQQKAKRSENKQNAEMNRNEMNRNTELEDPSDSKESQCISKISSRFIPPTLEEVQEYCKERNNNVNPVSFIDFYTSNGWHVGKNKMKDWRASVRTWESKNKKTLVAPTSYRPKDFNGNYINFEVKQ